MAVTEGLLLQSDCYRVTVTGGFFSYRVTYMVIAVQSVLQGDCYKLVVTW